MRQFRYELRKKYIYKEESSNKDENENPVKEKDETPFEDYDYLDGEPWKSFVASVDTEEWKKISEKAKKSVKENINPACVGRCGFVGLEPHIESRWNQLVSSYPHLDAIEHPSSIRNTVSKARLNPVTKLYELRENLISNGDLTGLLDLLDKKEKQNQPKDDGSYSTKKNKNEALETTFGEILGSPGMGLAAGSSSEILSIKKCELLHLDDQGALKVVAIGRVHPTDDMVVHGFPIIDGFVKVQVDRVVEGCGSTRLLPESCIYGEIELLKDAKGSFIQWPVKLIKILNKDSPQTVEPCHHFISTPYRPQFEATPADQHQAIPNERNEYQIYSYALQDDETFNQLFSENTTAEHVSFHKPTELVHAVGPGFGIDSVILVFMFKDGRDKRG
ncbi:hypothetical protein Hdeb2414_s0021g00576251 [Helianthus debilis subsp. tardiflorus]